MAGQFFRNKNNLRPKKRGAAKRRRIMEQKKRLLALGVPAEVLRRKTIKEIRLLIRRPPKIRKSQPVVNA